ncbi:MAG: Acetyl-CoA synthetase (ADP-forming) alpha and beta chains, putative, partial [uncultured Gemmatimonadetes bacterium]
ARRRSPPPLHRRHRREPKAEHHRLPDPGKPGAPRVQRGRVSREPHGHRGALHPRVPVRGRHSRPGGPGADRGSQAARARRGRGVRAQGDQGAGGDFGRLRGNPGRRHRAPERAHGDRAALRDAAGGPQLHGRAEHGARAVDERHLRAHDAARRAGFVHEPVGGDGRHHPGLRGRVRHRHLAVRLGRQQARRQRQRPDPVLGRRRADRGDPDVPGKLRKPAPLHAVGPRDHAEEADHRREVGPVRRRRARRLVAHRRAGGHRCRHGCAAAPVRGDPRGHGGGDVRPGDGLQPPADPARQPRGHRDQRGRSRHHHRRRVRGARAGGDGADGGDPGHAGGALSGGGVARQPRRHDRQRHGAELPDRGGGRAGGPQRRRGDRHLRPAAGRAPGRRGRGHRVGGGRQRKAGDGRADGPRGAAAGPGRAERGRHSRLPLSRVRRPRAGRHVPPARVAGASPRAGARVRRGPPHGGGNHRRRAWRGTRQAVGDGGDAGAAGVRHSRRAEPRRALGGRGGAGRGGDRLAGGAEGPFAEDHPQVRRGRRGGGRAGRGGAARRLSAPDQRSAGARRDRRGRGGGRAGAEDGAGRQGNHHRHDAGPAVRPRADVRPWRNLRGGAQGRGLSRAAGDGRGRGRDGAVHPRVPAAGRHPRRARVGPVGDRGRRAARVATGGGPRRHPRAGREPLARLPGRRRGGGRPHPHLHPI